MEKRFKKLTGIAGIVTAITATTIPLAINTQTIEAAVPVNQWKNENGYWYFYKNGKKTTGWKWFTSADEEKQDHWSYFGKDGKLRTSWKYLTTDDGEKKPCSR